jgi:hypothetical protein
MFLKEHLRQQPNSDSLFTFRVRGIAVSVAKPPAAEPDAKKYAHILMVFQTL